MLTTPSLLFVALFGLLPYITTVKLPPIPSYWSELLAVVLAICWLATLRASGARQLPPPPVARGKRGLFGTLPPEPITVPVAVLAFAAFAVTLLLQLLLGQPRFMGAPALTLLTLVLAALVCLASARVRAAGQGQRLLDVWAFAMCVALVLNLAAVLAERRGLHLYLFQLGWRDPPTRAEGLLGQPNHLAVFGVLASLAAHYLWMRGRLWAIGHVLLALSSAILIAGSASRAGAVLWVVGTVLGALAIRHDPRRVRGWWLLAIGMVLFLVAQVMWSRLDPATAVHLDVMRGNNSGRLELLRDSWELVVRHPLTGVGYGNLMGARWTELSGSLSESSAHHAHNLVAQILAELGVVAGGAVLLLLGYSLWGCARTVVVQGAAPEEFLAAAAVLVLAGYSLVEYPLWYTYFLLPFALMLGLVRQRDLRVAISVPALGVQRLGWALSLALCFALTLDYRRSEEAFSVVQLQQGKEKFASVTVPLQQASETAALSAFDVYANLMYSRALAPDGLFMQYKLGIAERAMLSMTNEETIARKIALLVATDDTSAARVLLARTSRDPTLERNTRTFLARLAPQHPLIVAFVETLPPLPAQGQ